MADKLAQVHREQAADWLILQGLLRVGLTGEKWSRCSVAFTFSPFILWKWMSERVVAFNKSRLLVSNTFGLVNKKIGREGACSIFGTEIEEKLQLSSYGMQPMILAFVHSFHVTGSNEPPIQSTVVNQS